MTFGFGFCSVLYGVRFSSGSCTFFFTFGFGSVLGKTCVLDRFVLAGFFFFSHLYNVTHALVVNHRCKKRFYVFYSGHVFLTFFLFFQRFLFLKTFIENLKSLSKRKQIGSV